jgi:hypothetical protein
VPWWFEGAHLLRQRYMGHAPFAEVQRSPLRLIEIVPAILSQVREQPATRQHESSKWHLWYYSGPTEISRPGAFDKGYQAP